MKLIGRKSLAKLSLALIIIFIFGFTLFHAISGKAEFTPKPIIDILIIADIGAYGLVISPLVTITERKKKILIDLDILTTALWDRKKESIEFLKEVEKGRYKVLTPLYFLYHILRKWEFKKLADKIFKQYDLLTDIFLQESKTAEKVLKKTRIPLRALAKKMVKGIKIKLEDAYLVLYSSIWESDFLVTYNKKHLVNKEKEITEFLKKYGLYHPKIILPDQLPYSTSPFKFLQPSFKFPGSFSFPFSSNIFSSNIFSHIIKLNSRIFKVLGRKSIAKLSLALIIIFILGFTLFHVISSRAEFTGPKLIVKDPVILGSHWSKKIIVYSNDSEHYHNISVFTSIPENLVEVELYRYITDITMMRVTDNPDYNFQTMDTDNNGKNDTAGWIVPELSEASFSVEGRLLLEQTTTLQTNPNANQVTQNNQITFDRNLDCHRCGQHKAPPLTDINMTITATASNPVTNGILIDYYPVVWPVINANGGSVSSFNSSYNKIEWNVGNVVDGVAKWYLVRSPALTSPPTKYYFFSELAGKQSDLWQIIVSDPVNENVTIFDDGFEVDISTNWAADSVWARATDQKHSGSYSAKKSAGSAAGNLATKPRDTSNAQAVYVDFWFMDDDLDPGSDLFLDFYNSSGVWVQIADLAGYTEDVWNNYQQKITDSQYFHSGFAIRFRAGAFATATENGWIDDVKIIKELAGENPKWGNQSQSTSTPAVGAQVNLSAYWTDNGALSYAVLSTNETGVWKNKTAYGSPLSFAGATSGWSNFTWQNSSIPAGTVVAWKIYANDTSGNENVTNVMTFEVKPTYLLVNLTYPSPLTYTETNPYQVVQNTTFWINASVKCYSEGEGGTCGVVSGAPRHNTSSPVPNTLVSETAEDIPFYIVSVWNETWDDTFSDETKIAGKTNLTVNTTLGRAELVRNSTGEYVTNPGFDETPNWVGWQQILATLNTTDYKSAPNSAQIYDPTGGSAGLTNFNQSIHVPKETKTGQVYLHYWIKYTVTSSYAPTDWGVRIANTNWYGAGLGMPSGVWYERWENLTHFMGQTVPIEWYIMRDAVSDHGIRIQVDDVFLTDTNGSTTKLVDFYNQTGWMVSEPISLSNSYGMLSAEYDVRTNTSVGIDVLNASDNTTIPGYANLSNLADISGISLSKYPNIRLKANFESDGKDTPVLYSWGVGSSYADYFFDSSKVESTTNVTHGSDLAVTNGSYYRLGTRYETRFNDSFPGTELNFTAWWNNTPSASNKWSVNDALNITLTATSTAVMIALNKSYYGAYEEVSFDYTFFSSGTKSNIFIIGFSNKSDVLGAADGGVDGLWWYFKNCWSYGCDAYPEPSGSKKFVFTPDGFIQLYRDGVLSAERRTSVKNISYIMFQATTGDVGSMTVSIDNFLLAVKKYNQTGNLTSKEIKPSTLRSWKKFYANHEIDTNTNITYKILNATDNSVLCNDILPGQASAGYDISSCASGAKSIKLSANLSTSNDSYTPMLHDWNVSWTSLKSCGVLDYGDSCQLDWTINATGATNSIWAIDVNFTSSVAIPENNTADAIVKITSGAAGTQPPQWSNNQSYYPSEYNPSVLTIFNVTWSDDSDANGFNVSLIEGNWSVAGGQNYTMFRFPGTNISSYNLTLPAGTFYWKVYANDSQGAWNSTDTWYFTIAKNTSGMMRLFLNGTESNRSYTQNQVANFTAYLNISGKTIYLDSNYSGWTLQSGSNSVVYNYTTLSTTGNWWNLTAYWNGDENYTESSQTYFFNVTVPGNLIVNLTEPSSLVYTASNPKNVAQNSTFVVNATVQCTGGYCGSINATLYYNSSGTINQTVSTTPGATPLYVMYEGNPIQLGTMDQGDLKFANFTVNATGTVGEIHYLYVNFTSSDASVNFNVTNASYVNITAEECQIAIGLSTWLSSEVNFTGDPGQTTDALGNNGAGTTNYYVNVSVSGSCNPNTVNIYIKADGDLISGPNNIPLANMKQRNSTTDSTVPPTIPNNSLTTSYLDNKIGSNLPDGSNVWLKFILDIPINVAAGTYSNTVYIKGTRSDVPP
jgi:hypothetical protein